MFLRDFFSLAFNEPVREGFALLVAWAPLWVPLVLLYIFWRWWIEYVRADFIANQEYVLLDVRLPKEIVKSPRAMELVLDAFYNPVDAAHWLDRYWNGKTRPWFSLELVSLEGAVHFFVWSRTSTSGNIENAIYAQFPNAEVHVVDDYTRFLKYDNDETYKMFGSEFVLTKADPYPIKTYVDYGLDKDPKEELKVDPLTPVLEWLGSLGKGEQGWIQIMIRAHKSEDKQFAGIIPALILGTFALWPFSEKGLFGAKGPLFGTKDKWKDDVKDEIEKIVKDRKIKDSEDKGPIKLTKGEEQVVEALERSITKTPFDTGIRGIYIAEADQFNPAGIGGLMGSWRQFSTGHLNGFKPANVTGVKFPWYDPFKKVVRRKKRELFDAYRRRSLFHPPYKGKHFVLNGEELATLFHFPGEVAETPTLGRTPSRKAEPPTDLPLEI